MKKVYLTMSLAAILGLISCGSSDTTSEEATTESSVSSEGANGASGTSRTAAQDAAVIEAYANDKSGITTADIDAADTSFTTRSKTLYLSDENGKKLAVVYGLKATPTGIAIIEVEGEKAITLKQVATATGAPYQFSNGTITLKQGDKAVQLDENGEVVTYKEVL